MSRFPALPLSFFLIAGLAACEGDPDETPAPPENGAETTQTLASPSSSEEPETVQASAADTVPVESAALLAYLQSAGYRSFNHEAEPHESVGPHPSPALRQKSTVQAFFNAPLDASLKSGRATHPEGSAVVKEFRDDGGALSGWAVAVKTEEESDGGNGWYWYEILGTDGANDPVADGNGVQLCAGCHAAGNDFVLSDYP